MMQDTIRRMERPNYTQCNSVHPVGGKMLTSAIEIRNTFRINNKGDVQDSLRLSLTLCSVSNILKRKLLQLIQFIVLYLSTSYSLRYRTSSNILPSNLSNVNPSNNPRLHLFNPFYALFLIVPPLLQPPPNLLPFKMVGPPDALHIFPMNIKTFF